MTKEIVAKVASNLSENLGKELNENLKKFIGCIILNNELNVGIREKYELKERKITFGHMLTFTGNETVVDNKYRPSKFYSNNDNYYFGSEEITRFNSGDTFFGIIGERWVENGLGDEFVEAIIFGNHNIKSIDCMLGTVKINSPLDIPKYVKPGSLVTLHREEFKNTKYLRAIKFMSSCFTRDDDNNNWNLGNYLNTYYWNGENYTNEPIHSVIDEEYYGDGDYLEDEE